MDGTSTMSWNARRFAIAANDSRYTRGRQALWLTPDAIERIGSALNHETLNLADAPPFPDEGLVVGFGTGMETKVGDTVYAVRVIPLPHGQGAVHTHMCTPQPTLGEVLSQPDWAQVFRPIGGSMYYAMSQRMEFLDAQSEMVADSEIGRVSLGDSSRALFTSEGLPTDDLLVDGLNPAERGVLRYFAHSAWALLHEPIEREVSATTLSTAPIRTGKGRRAKDVSVSVIDVRRSAATRSAPSGRVIEHDHRWTRRGHWAWRACGKGKTERRRVWLDEVVCGPADKPLLRRPKVSVLR